MRIDKLLGNLKYGSRKEIKDLARKNSIKVNGIVINDSSITVDPVCDKIEINDQMVFYKDSIHLMINKPKNYLSANHDGYHKTVIDLIKEPYSRFDLKIAGRLDIDSIGLIILTTDGNFVHQITSPNSNVAKTYEVILEKSIQQSDIEKLIEGVIIKDGNNQEFFSKAIKIEQLEEKKCLIVIDEGKFHQVKRMFEAVKNKVIELKRIKIGNLELNDLEEGKYIEFSKEELL
ncbi:MAG: pseudouridine synthase [Acholeplasma sp.]|nr:pseudouridine synthase [Acholeplasma sp.]